MLEFCSGSHGQINLVINLGQNELWVHIDMVCFFGCFSMKEIMKKPAMKKIIMKRKKFHWFALCQQHYNYRSFCYLLSSEYIFITSW